MEDDAAGVTTSLEEPLRLVLEHIRSLGLIVSSDRRFPSLVSLLGGPIGGSWWGQAGQDVIFAVGQRLAVSDEVLVVKLVSGKLTYVHRALWPAILSVATAGEAWQVRSLSPLANELFIETTRLGDVRTDQFALEHRVSRKVAGDAARELETRLLVRGESAHTETGAHSKRLESWKRWMAQTGFRGEPLDADRARQELEGIVERLNVEFGARGRLPWDLPTGSL